MGYPATPRTWVAGDVLTAAQLNAELRDALLGAFPLGPPDVAWTAYTPTLTQTGAVTKTVTYARYQRVGRLIVAQFALSCTGAGTGGIAVIMGLPVAAAAVIPAGQTIGAGKIGDASTGLAYRGLAELLTATTFGFIPTSGTNNNYLGTVEFTAALASGDGISATVTYEAAA